MSTTRVGQLFDEKASGWSAKYRTGGSLVTRLERFENALRSHASLDAPVLDFGCGAGDLSAHLARAGWRMTGIDVSGRMIAAAQSAHPAAASWLQLDADWATLPFGDGAFAAVVASSVLEYVPGLDVTLRELFRVLKPGGVFFATVPDVTVPVRRLEGALQSGVLPALTMLRPFTPGRIRRYVDYLELSRNRFPVDTWHAWGRLAGFEPLALDPTHEPLLLLGFRRK